MKPCLPRILSWIMSLMLYLKRYHCTQGYLCFLMSFSKIFIVLHFALRSMINFVWIFVKDVKSMARLFSFFCMWIPIFFQHQLLKRLYLLHCIVFAPFTKISLLCIWGPISGLYILYHWFICLFFCQYHSVKYYSFIVSLEVWWHKPSNILLLLQYYIG